MDWIQDMDLTFITCGCKGKLQTTYTVRQFRLGAIRQWITLGKIIIPNEPLQITWGKLLIHLKSMFYLTQNKLKLHNQFLTLKKGNMSIDEYTNAFIEKMEFILCLLHDKLIKFDKQPKRLPQDYVVLLPHTPTHEATIWTARSIKDMIKERATDKAKVSEERKNEGLSKSDKTSTFKNFDPNNKRSRGNNSTKLCYKCKVKKVQGLVTIPEIVRPMIRNVMNVQVIGFV